MVDGSSSPETQKSSRVEPVSPKPRNPSSSFLEYARSRVRSIMHIQESDTRRLGGNPEAEPDKLKLHRGVTQFGLEEKVAINIMTGLLNRDPYLAERERIIGSVNRDINAPEVEGIRIDLDDFGEINIGWGDPKGDEVLSTVGRTIREIIRVTDTAGRTGGEEFEIVTQRTTSPTREIPEESVSLAERLRIGIEQMGLGIRRSVTASIGITRYIRGETIEKYNDRLDSAEKCAKKTGKNRVVEGYVENGEDRFVNIFTKQVYKVYIDDDGKKQFEEIKVPVTV